MCKKHWALLCAILLAASFLIVPAKAAYSPFSDVNSGDWYYSVVTQMSSDGYISGYGDGTFKPNRNVTGAEMLTILQRAFRDPRQLPGPNQWGSFQWDSLGWFTTSNFHNGYNDPVSRNLMCQTLLEAMGTKALNQNLYMPHHFTDKISNSVFTCWKYGYVSGCPDGAFHGGDVLTRAQLCAILYRAIYQNPNPIAPHVDFEVTTPYDLVGFTDTFTAGQQMEAALLCVPTEVRQAFQDHGFIIIGTTPSEYRRLWDVYIRTPYSFSSGVFFYHKNQEEGELGGIMVNNLDGTTVTHEFGHFMYYFFMDEVKVEELYRAEKDGIVAASSRQYGSTSSHEFIAEAFRVYCSHPDILRGCAPNTYSYIKTILDNM